MLGIQNIRVIASYYTQITLSRLTELLDLSPAEAESTLCRLVTETVVKAKIDRPAGIVDFTPKKNPDEVLNAWSGDLGKMLDLIEKTSHLINKVRAIQSGLELQQRLTLLRSRSNRSMLFTPPEAPHEWTPSTSDYPVIPHTMQCVVANILVNIIYHTIQRVNGFNHAVFEYSEWCLSMKYALHRVGAWRMTHCAELIQSLVESSCRMSLADECVVLREMENDARIIIPEIYSLILAKISESLNM